MSTPVTVTSARDRDGIEIQAAVEQLINELSGAVWRAADFQSVFQRILANPELSGILVARTEGVVVGVLTYSQTLAIRTGGAYLTIQELWVDSARRGARIGHALMAKAKNVASQRGITDIEVGLPSQSFPSFVATEAFYAANGFSAIGPRYRFRDTQDQ